MLQRVGFVLSLICCLPFIPSAAMKFVGGAQIEEGFAHLGVPLDLRVTIGVIEVLSLLAFAIPKIRVMGAILLTGYLGGAIMTHLRIGEPPVIQTILAILIWFSLYLRDPKLREILPFSR